MTTVEEKLKYANGFFYTEDFVYHEQSVKDLMKEHAIEFAKEINRQGYREYDESDLWISQSVTGNETFTTVELYLKFEKENNK